MKVENNMYELLDSLHQKILKSRFAEQVTEQEIEALIEAKHRAGAVTPAERKKDMSEYNMDGLNDLKSAIVLQAVEDYERAIAVLSTEYSVKTKKARQRVAEKKSKAQQWKNDCEKFFGSAWFKALTSIESEIIVERINCGIHNAYDLIYDEKEKGYICHCGARLRVSKTNAKNEKGNPVTKCKTCGKYHRVFGKPIDIE